MVDQISSESRAELVRKLGILTLRSERDSDFTSSCSREELNPGAAAQVEEELKRVEATDAVAIILDRSSPVSCRSRTQSR